MTWTPPTPNEQVQFLRDIQRLLAEGDFNASYKYALLLAFADMCVLKGDDSGAPLELSKSEIAEKFIEFYWQQSRPFETAGENTGIILLQNKGPQAAVISNILQAQRDFSGSLFRLRQFAQDRWQMLVKDVQKTVSSQPLRYLQNVGGETITFLYDKTKKRNTITLKPKVAFCFRAFYGLMRDLLQGAWVRFVQKLNATKLGNLSDLGTFLFGTHRASLEAYREVLLEIQGGSCFYCKKALYRSVDVDHFVPWSRYPTDLGHNFVLSHPKCNGDKSDHLAADEHLAAWAERNKRHTTELDERLSEAALPHDLTASLRVAEWAYDQTEKSNGQVWVAKDVFRHLGPDWRKLLAA